MNFDHRDAILANTVSNKDHVADINYSIRYTRWFLRLLGIWPLVMSKPTMIEKNMAKILLPLSLISMIILTIPIVTYAIIFRRADRAELIILLGPMILQTTNVIKHILMIFRSDLIKTCMRHMETDWRRVENPNDRDVMIRNVRLAHNLTIVCTVCMYSGSILYHGVKPICSGKTIIEFNETIRPLVYPGTDIFFDVQASPNYELVFCGQFVSALFHFTVSTAVSNLAVVLVSHACGQIQIVISRLEKLVDHNAGNDRMVIENRIAFIVQNHVRSLEYAKNIEKVLREICLMEVLAESLIICFLEYYCITEWSHSDRVAIITYVILLIAFAFNLFLYCQVGEVLKEKCQEVGKAAYMIEWYRLPAKTSLALVMIITTASYPRNLTAGGMMELSKLSFASIIKTSFAYLNILRTGE